MSSINIIYDFSPYRPWIFHTLWSNKNLLHKNGIRLALPDPWSIAKIPDHGNFWLDYGHLHNEPTYLKREIEDIASHLKKGGKVLFLSRTHNPDLHKIFRERIKRLGDWPVLSRIFIGNPLFSLENLYRENVISVPDSTLVNWTHLCSRLPEIITYIQTQYGPDNLSLIPVKSEKAAIRPSQRVLEESFTWLNVAEKFEDPVPILHPLFFQSASARKLCFTHEVRFNSWPKLDVRDYFSALQKADSVWGEEIVVPEKYRKNPALLESVATIESTLGMKNGELEVPANFMTATSVNPGDLLSSERAQFFVQQLSPENRSVLQQRFQNDAALLTANQRTLAAAVNEDKGFEHLEEIASEPLLTVLTMTYNHEKYIGKCIESVLQQKTSFPIRHIVLDHHSSDGTPEIVAQYAKLHPSIKPVLLSARKHPENVTGLFMRCKSKYAALCDGDDYFTDPLKLQKQVDFLEHNSDCAICFHPVLVHFDDKSSEDFLYPPLKTLPGGIKSKYIFEDILSKNLIQTNSAVYRWRFRAGLPNWFDATLCPGDWYWHLLHAETGKLGFIPEVMSVYRRHGNAVYHNAFKDKLAHRRESGMKELRVYEVVDKHFKGKYHKKLQGMAANVFNDFLNIYLETQDSFYIDQACAKFPEFGRYYLNLLQLESSKKGAQK